MAEFIVDETTIKAGSEYVWLWVAMEPKNKQILTLSIYRERNIFVAERFLLAIVKDYGKRPVPTDFAESRQRSPYTFLKVIIGDTYLPPSDAATYIPLLVNNS